MCGIVGVGNYSGSAIGLWERDIFMDMLVADAARGVDGTGIFRVNVKGGGKVDWAKAYGTPFDLFRSDGFKEHFWEQITSLYIRWLVGHNRFATTGGKDTESAHPFEVGNIVLVHNGTLTDFYLPEFQEKEGKEKKYKVDSHAICAAINRIGIKETLKGFKGAYTFVYYDKKAKTLNLIRNWQRPLYIGTCKKEKTVVFASEKHMLTWACERNKVYLDDIFELPEGMLYSYGLDEWKPKITQIVEPYSSASTTYLPAEKGKNGIEEDGKSFWHEGIQWVLNEKTGVYHKQQGGNIVNASQVTAETGKQEKTYPEKKRWSPTEGFQSTSAALLGAVVGKLGEKGIAEGKQDKGEKDVHITTMYGGIAVGDMVEFTFDNYDKLSGALREVGPQIYMISGKFSMKEVSHRDDLVVNCRVKGVESLDALMQCDRIGGKVVSIHCPKDYAKPVKYFVAFPTPIWNKQTAASSYAALPEPLDDSIVPASALMNLIEGE